MNWYEIKLATLKKIDPSISNLTPTRNTKDYLNSIVEVANRGLFDLATAGKFIIRQLRVNNYPFDNLLGNEFLSTRTNKEITYKANGRSYYLEVYGPATINVYVDDNLIVTMENTFKEDFTAYRGNVPNEEKKTLELKIEGEFPHIIRHAAIYEEMFESDEMVPPFTPVLRYPIKEKVSDFYKLSEADIVKEGQSQYSKFREYYWEGDNTLVLPRDAEGTFLVHYYAYPSEITTQTEDEYELPLDEEVAAILPLYMASELMVDDDASVANYFREQYEQAKTNLRPTSSRSKAEFINEMGW